MSLVTDNVQIGVSATNTFNFTLAVPSLPDGTLTLKRGGYGTPVSTVFSVDAANNIFDGNGYELGFKNAPLNYQGAAYTLVSSDRGKLVSITTGGVTIPSGVFSAGQSFMIYNDSGSNQTITQGSGVTVYLCGTSTTGNRTLAQRGVASVLCVGVNTFVINGGGLS